MNSFVSVRPILELPGAKQSLGECAAPIIAISPVVAGEAIKGPTAKMMRELGIPCNVLSIAEYYRDLIDGLVIDKADAEQAPEIEKLGVAVKVVSTVMGNLEDRVQLAKATLLFADQLK